MLFAFAIILAVLSLPFYLAYHHHHQNNNPHIDPIKSRQIITGKQLTSQSNQNKTKKNHLTQLQSRAIPNQRVRVVFGADNAFTSHDENHVRQFIAKARELIHLHQGDWYTLAGMARMGVRGVIERAFEASYPSASASSRIAHVRIPLVNLIQTVTLRVMLRVLFTMEEEEVLNIQDEHLLNLANAINDTWISSKTTSTSTTPTLRFEDNHHLQESLTTIFPNTDITRENPLNLLLPGFETMWRVILRAFLETGYTPAGIGHPEWRGILAAFARIPTREQFTLVHDDEDSSSGGGVSVEMLVNEALRLYPPTRRVYRAFQFAEPAPEPESSSSSPCTSRSKSNTIASADIETTQTAPSIWGPEASVFNPQRWKCGLATTQERNAFFPFGSAPFVCPAQKVFGPRVIGLVLGVLFLELGVGVWVLRSDDSDAGLEGLRAGVRLSNERDAYRELYLVRGGDLKKPE